MTKNKKENKIQKEWESRLRRQEKLLKERREAQAVIDKIEKKLERNNNRLNDMVRMAESAVVPSIIEPVKTEA